MRREDRRQEILDLLISKGSVEVDLLSEQLSVSKMTIHRDLDELEELGMLQKIRGAATTEPGTQFESDFRFRALQGQSTNKHYIGLLLLANSMSSLQIKRQMKVSQSW